MMRAIVAAISICLASGAIASAQTAPQKPRTPPNLAIKGVPAIFSQDDILAAMSPGERKDFKERRQELKELQKNGRALPKGSAGRRVIWASLQEKLKEFNELYDVFRGFNGKTVTLWGDPPPTKVDIIMIAVMERRTGAGDGLVYPHWERRRDGAIVGTIKAPNEATSGSSYPAGPTVGGLIGIGSRDLPRISESCRKLPPPPARMANPVCKCGEISVLYGTTTMPSCNWTEAE